MPDYTQPPFVTVYACDGFLCRWCSGGKENITLTGKPGWNYVLCEEIAESVQVEVAGSNQIGYKFSVTFCEFALFGLDGELSKNKEYTVFPELFSYLGEPNKTNMQWN